MMTLDTRGDYTSHGFIAWSLAMVLSSKVDF